MASVTVQPVQSVRDAVYLDAFIGGSVGDWLSRAIDAEITDMPLDQQLPSVAV
jgi:hypothetical protein